MKAPFDWLSCGHGCVFGSPHGMAPNGPCHCLDTSKDPDRRVLTKKKIRALCDAVTRLQEDLDSVCTLLSGTRSGVFHAEDRAEVARFIARMQSRWVPIKLTSRTGKQLFVCTICGRVSPTPDKKCNEPEIIQNERRRLGEQEAWFCKKPDMSMYWKDWVPCHEQEAKRSDENAFKVCATCTHWHRPRCGLHDDKKRPFQSCPDWFKKTGDEHGKEPSSQDV